MIIKLASTAIEGGALIYWMDDVTSPSHARAYGVLMASKFTSADRRTLVWHLHGKGKPEAPADVAAAYEAMKVDTFYEASANDATVTEVRGE